MFGIIKNITNINNRKTILRDLIKSMHPHNKALIVY